MNPQAPIPLNVVIPDQSVYKYPTKVASTMNFAVAWEHVNNKLLDTLKRIRIVKKNKNR